MSQRIICQPVPVTIHTHFFQRESSISSTTSSVDSLLPPASPETSVTSIESLTSPTLIKAKLSKPPSKKKKVTFTSRQATTNALKLKAEAIPATGKAHATVHQKEMLEMIYTEITGYPDRLWMAQIALTIHMHYKTVQNWFSNRRASEKNTFRPSASQPMYKPEADYTYLVAENRRLKLRLSAIETWPEWDDEFFKEVLVITDFRSTLARVQYQEKMANDAKAMEQQKREAAETLLMLSD